MTELDDLQNRVKLETVRVHSQFNLLGAMEKSKLRRIIDKL